MNGRNKPWLDEIGVRSFGSLGAVLRQDRTEKREKDPSPDAVLKASLDEGRELSRADRWNRATSRRLSQDLERNWRNQGSRRPLPRRDNGAEYSRLRAEGSAGRRAEERRY